MRSRTYSREYGIKKSVLRTFYEFIEEKDLFQTVFEKKKRVEFPDLLFHVDKNCFDF